MKRKKIATLLIAGVLALGIVGGSFAWFTSSDKATNSFATAGNDNTSYNGIQINESFKPPTSVKPGDSTDKIVSVKNVADFDQFIRVKITIKDVTDQNGKTKGFSASEIQKNIILDFGDNLTPCNNGTYALDAVQDSASYNHPGNGLETGKWADGKDGYYYYIGKVSKVADKNSITSDLLEKVKLATSAGNDWQNVKYDILIDAEGIQASNDAYKDLFKNADKKVLDALGKEQNK